MKKIVHTIAFVFTILTMICFITYMIHPSDIFLTLTITFFTTSYHFDMRIVVGYIVDKIMNNKADYHKKWYHPLSFEEKLYELLKVKNWKDKMPTYSPEIFSLETHTFEDIIQSMCQSEIVHEIIVVLSFVPILFIPLFGVPIVFIITSILAACFDIMFVIMQRYNRPRIIRLIEKRKNRNK